ncbi:MAG: tRNA 2-selenouridine(34) synthase MnmH [Betaproteobacteria bacterium]
MSERHAGALRVGIDAIAGFADRIDVRSPAEFALDHVPGAVSHPVLDDEQRARIGTLYAASPFDARRLGAALVARNIASMLDRAFADKPRDWRPLVYCWRGGQRSRALAHVLNEIGWRAMQLDGGYRAYRREVTAQLRVVPARLDFVVVGGLTGSGKSRLIVALDAARAQALDLEKLAAHRGSLLGDLPDAPQPSQKAFESALLERLQRFDPSRPVFVEAESRRVGTLQLPDALLERMRAGRGIALATAQPLRVALLKEDYPHFLADADALGQRLQRLVALHGKTTLAHWTELASAGEWDALIGELLSRHYDPAYARSHSAHYAPAQPTHRVDVDDVSPRGFAALAQRLAVRFAPRNAVAAH